MGGHGFRRTVRGRIVLHADDVERELLVSLVQQLVELVRPEQDDDETDPLAAMVGIDADAVTPDDPALHRLLPDAYPDDDEASDEFRRFTERSLRELKLGHAATVLATLERSGPKITLADGEPEAWLGTLNDLRLTIATRLGLDEDNHELFHALPSEHPAYALFGIYDWCTYLQETLVHALTGLRSELPPDED